MVEGIVNQPEAVCPLMDRIASTASFFERKEQIWSQALDETDDASFFEDWLQALQCYAKIALTLTFQLTRAIVYCTRTSAFAPHAAA